MTEKRGPIFFAKGEKIFLKRDGTWIADGIEITHEQTRELFYQSIGYDTEKKEYYLHVGYERLYIEIEDTPYFVTNVEKIRELFFATLANHKIIQLDSDKVSYKDTSTGPAIYVTLDDGLKARFLSPAYYSFLKFLEEDKEHYFVTIDGKKLSLLKKVAN